MKSHPDLREPRNICALSTRSLDIGMTDINPKIIMFKITKERKVRQIQNLRKELGVTNSTYLKKKKKASINKKHFIKFKHLMSELNSTLNTDEEKFGISINRF